MPEYLSPGVYIEELGGPQPITAVSTSTAGAVGMTLKGPTSGKPVLVTSFADFVRTFGSFMPEPLDPQIVNVWTDPKEGGRWWQFAHAVQGFFANGGQRLFVKRVFSSQAKASTAFLGTGFISPLAADAPGGATSLRLADLIHLDAGAPGGSGTAFGIVRGDTGAVTGGFNVGAYDPQANTVTLAAGQTIPEDLKAGRDFVEIHPRPANPPTDNAGATLDVEASARGAFGDNLAVRVVPMVGAALGILPDPGTGAPLFTQVVTAAQAGDTSLEVREVAGRLDATPTPAVPFTVLIGQQEIEVTAVASPPAPPAGGPPPAPPSVVLTVPALDADLPAGTSVQVLRRANLANPSTIYVANAGRLYPGAIVELDNRRQKETRVVQSVAGSLVTLDSNLALAYLEGHVLRLVEAQVSVRSAPPGEAPVVETFSNLRLVRDGSPSSLIDLVNARSRYVRLSAGGNYSETDLTGFPTAASGGWEPLAGGDDAISSLSIDDFVGQDGGSGNRTGIQALEDRDEVAIALVPGIWSQTVQAALVTHCETLKDRFAILDTQDGLSIDDVLDVRNSVPDTKYAALYHPWVLVRDPLTARDIPIAPSGHVAGIYARVDVERGVHKAPANEVIRGIAGLYQDITKREQDQLNPVGINALRFFPGRGFRVWGARTVSSDTTWRYVNVRRLFIMIEESIDEGTQFVVFEPNTPDLWARIRQTITNFLTTVWRSGALFGTTAAQAFYVVCDETTMTQDDIDNGRLICEIGIAPAKPAEFVIFRIQQKTALPPSA